MICNKRDGKNVEQNFKWFKFFFHVKLRDKEKSLTSGNHFGFFQQDLRLRYHSLFTKLKVSTQKRIQNNALE